MLLAYYTHPVISANQRIDHPPAAQREEPQFFSFSPLYVVERGDTRSVVGVSQLCAMPLCHAWC